MEGDRGYAEVPAQYILALLACAFLLVGIFRRLTRGPSAQSRTWLLIGSIFAAVSTWLFCKT